MAGIALAVVGVIVAVVAVIALTQPKNGSSANGGSTSSASSSGTSSVTSTRHATPDPAPSGSGGGSNSASPVQLSSAPPNSASQSAATHAVPLIVLNNSTIGGLAAGASERFRSGGWTVTDTGNLTNNIISTCAYYDPSDPAARPAAEALQAQYPTIKRVEPRFPELPSGPVVVVLTSDYSSG